jgi:hypothetical protein
MLLVQSSFSKIHHGFTITRASDAHNPIFAAASFNPKNAVVDSPASKRDASWSEVYVAVPYSKDYQI